MMNKLSYIALVSVLLIASCKNEPSKIDINSSVNFEEVKLYYVKNLEDAIQNLEELSTLNPQDSTAKGLFESLRSSFKVAEPFAGYLNPVATHRANGPALPVYLEDTGKILEPFGLQKIEETIYEGNVPKWQYTDELARTLGLLNVLKNYVTSKELTASRFFLGIHQQLLRILSHSISGFDTPVSHLGIHETIVSLESLWHVYDMSIRTNVKSKDSDLDTLFKNNIEDAVAFIESNKDFDTFDRYTFISKHLTPITRSWMAIREKSGLWEHMDDKPFNYDAPTFFENTTFNTKYFTPARNRNPSQKQISLGKQLFYDANLSANKNMACVTCHNPEKAFADGLVVNSDTDGRPLQRNTPTLINSIFQGNFFWDGRSSTLVDQIGSVFTNEKEFNSSVHQFSTNILKDSTYITMFREGYGKVPTQNTEIIRAISAYVATLNGFNSRFDRNMRGEITDFSKEEKLGMNLFMGKALCATCHFMPLTNGAVPPFYAEHEREVIGVPKTAANTELDDDLGFYWRFGEELHKGMFKTPTVRNAALTAPYMHNGVYATLAEVMDFYNKGGGGGLGFDLEHQTLPFDDLEPFGEETNDWLLL